MWEEKLDDHPIHHIKIMWEDPEIHYITSIIATMIFSIEYTIKAKSGQLSVQYLNAVTISFMEKIQF